MNTEPGQLISDPKSVESMPWHGAEDVWWKLSLQVEEALLEASDLFGVHSTPKSLVKKITL